MLVLNSASLPKFKETPTLSHKLVTVGGELCEADIAVSLPQPVFPRMPQLPPSSNKTFHETKMLFLFDTDQLNAKKLKPFQKDEDVVSGHVTFKGSGFTR